MEEDKYTEIVFGNKNVAESGSTQINITQNNFDAAKVAELLGLNPETGASPLKPETKTRQSRSRKPARVVEDVYTYCWVTRQEGRMRLIQLYQLLTDERFRMLDPGVSPDVWCSLFMGTAHSFTMKWTGKQAHLRYLFKLLMKRKYITFDKKSAKQWEILGSHFLNAQGKPFTDWDSQHDPSRGARTLEMFAEVLNIHSAPPKAESLTEEINKEMRNFSDWEMRGC